MSARFTVLGSGSSGNVSLLETPGGGLLLDCGLPPKEIGDRLAAIGSSWDAISAVVITHTHTDHWNRYTLEHLRRLNIRFIAHKQHLVALATVPAFEPLRRAGLAIEYTEGTQFVPLRGLSCIAVPVSHDSDPTFAIRCDAVSSCGGTWAVGLASDLGVVSEPLLTAFAGVDLLAIEFNHDVKMERASRRPRFLVNRVLGDKGHLSNLQAGEAVQAIAATVDPGHLRAVVQLHLSRECNTAELAAHAGKTALGASSPHTRLITATQDRPAETVELSLRPQRAVGMPKLLAKPRASMQLVLPGMEG